MAPSILEVYDVNPPAREELDQTITALEAELAALEASHHHALARVWGRDVSEAERDTLEADHLKVAAGRACLMTLKDMRILGNIVSDIRQYWEALAVYEPLEAELAPLEAELHEAERRLQEIAWHGGADGEAPALREKERALNDVIATLRDRRDRAWHRCATVGRRLEQAGCQVDSLNVILPDGRALERES